MRTSSLLLSRLVLLKRRRTLFCCNALAEMSTAPLPETALSYFHDTYLFEASARLLACLPAADGRVAVVLDKTVLYPSGGGQPADAGSLQFAGGALLPVFDVTRTKEGVVHHVVEACDAAVGSNVTVRVDAATRLLHARIHSAGHLLDVCMARSGYPPETLPPTKGSHTPQVMWVEYSGKVADADRLVKKLNEALAAAVAAGGRVVAKGTQPRVVTLLAGTEAASGCPCGGTHVADVAEIGRVTVTGVRVKKGVTRVSYTVEGAPTATDASLGAVQRAA